MPRDKVERHTRERILREAIGPQVRQAQEIVAQVQASLVRVAREITAAIAGDAQQLGGGGLPGLARWAYVCLQAGR